MRDTMFEQVYLEQFRDYHRKPLVENAQPPQQAQQPQQQKQQPQQAANTSNSISLDQARQIVAQELTAFCKRLVDKQIGDQNWANEIFQELGKTMSNKLQDKFAKSDSPEPKQQPQPTTPTNPAPQATPQNNR